MYTNLPESSTPMIDSDLSNENWEDGDCRHLVYAGQVSHDLLKMDSSDEPQFGSDRRQSSLELEDAIRREIIKSRLGDTDVSLDEVRSEGLRRWNMDMDVEYQYETFNGLPVYYGGDMYDSEDPEEYDHVESCLNEEDCSMSNVGSSVDKCMSEQECVCNVDVASSGDSDGVESVQVIDIFWRTVFRFVARLSSWPTVTGEDRSRVFRSLGRMCVLDVHVGQTDVPTERPGDAPRRCLPTSMTSANDGELVQTTAMYFPRTSATSGELCTMDVRFRPDVDIPRTSSNPGEESAVEPGYGSVLGFSQVDSTLIRGGASDLECLPCQRKDCTKDFSAGDMLSPSISDLSGPRGRGAHMLLMARCPHRPSCRR